MGGEFKESMCGEWSKRFSLNGSVNFSSLKTEITGWGTVLVPQSDREWLGRQGRFAWCTRLPLCNRMLIAKAVYSLQFTTVKLCTDNYLPRCGWSNLSYFSSWCTGEENSWCFPIIVLDWLELKEWQCSAFRSHPTRFKPQLFCLALRMKVKTKQMNKSLLLGGISLCKDLNTRGHFHALLMCIRLHPSILLWHYNNKRELSICKCIVPTLFTSSLAKIIIRTHF